ncbi:MAG TPA: lysylphosphatidylglycerol synthase domain-containing protein, partial [Dissulfurispiraceae bacterium]|nr:lysylphosphatidylglycerol synthase domain-containing protein [Dissulfurispiraceae bacterium]
GLLALLMIGAVSVVYLSGKGSSFLAAYKHEMRILVVVSVLVISSFIAFIFLGKNARVREKIKGMAYRFLKQGFFYNIVEGFGAVTKRRRYPVYAFLLSLVIQMISLAGILVLINIHFDKAPDVVPLMAVSSLVMLLGVIPVTPGNIGWTELLATYGWSAVGSNNGAEIFFYWRVVTLLCSLPGGFFYFFPPRNRDIEKSV